MHVEVDANLTVAAAHELAHQVKAPSAPNTPE